jgi:hypothetical protein
MGAARQKARPRGRALKIAVAIGCLFLAGTAAFARAEVIQEGSLRLALDGELSPQRLPRSGQAPIAVSVSWNISTTDGTEVPKLSKLAIEINRNGHFDSAGLPTCEERKIQTASTDSALAACRSALVGEGSFKASVALSGQLPYASSGRLLVFNGKKAGKPVLLGQIYAPHPFPTSFVIVFKVQKQAKGAYGTTLAATLPKALSAWGSLTGIEMTLSRKFTVKGKSRSYVSAGCHTPKGIGLASFNLARTSFKFTDGRGLTATAESLCKVSR